MPLHYQDERAEIHKLVVGPMDNNVFVLRCTETGEAPRPARRDPGAPDARFPARWGGGDREYREYLSEEQRRQPGYTAARCSLFSVDRPVEGGKVALFTRIAA